MQQQKEVPKISEFNYNQDIFHGDLYKEVMINCFNDKEPNLIDVDIVDYCDEYAFIENNIKYIKINIFLRKIYYNKNIGTHENWYSLCFKENEIKVNNKNYEVVTCNGCGNSLSYIEKECSSCGRINDSKNNWILIQSEITKPN